ncbi:hypothetical protein Gste01_02351 [Geobacillus stearothermophilus ATCC 7953]
MLSIPLGLPELKVIKQELHSYGYAIHIEKTETLLSERVVSGFLPNQWI